MSIVIWRRLSHDFPLLSFEFWRSFDAAIPPDVIHNQQQSAAPVQKGRSFISKTRLRGRRGKLSEQRSSAQGSGDVIRDGGYYGNN
jgi:hypothetical protein